MNQSFVFLHIPCQYEIIKNVGFIVMQTFAYRDFLLFIDKVINLMSSFTLTY